MCGVCNDEEEVHGINTQGEKELEASDEGEQGEKVKSLPTPTIPHSASIVTTVLRTFHISPGVLTASKVVDVSLDISGEPKGQVRPRLCLSITLASATARIF